MGVWQGVAMDSLKFRPGPTMPYPSTVVSGVAHPLGKRLAAIFYPFGHPKPYAYAFQIIP
jgi:hypothetical protein